jgi:hypothetical protein
MSRAAWAWELRGAAGEVLDRPVSPTFTSRFDAEAWLGEHWRDLAAQSVADARLLHLGAQVAAPVALRRD